MISIINYGLGNVRAFSNMYKRMNIETQVVTAPAQLSTATKVILPGVGAFDEAMKLLDESGMRPALDHIVKVRDVPVLGVCVGMQILAEASDEGVLPGLSWIPGRVRAFKSVPDAADLPAPHMGWNDVRPASKCPLFRGLETEARFYFLHSFYFECARASDTAATSVYGVEFSCAVNSHNIYGVQFHPEKSHHYGARLLRNFATL